MIKDLQDTFLEKLDPAVLVPAKDTDVGILVAMLLYKCK